jgi:transcriptional regulator with PAS, ATPase and Fis domain
MQEESKIISARVKMKDRFGRTIPVAITAAVLQDEHEKILGGVESFHDDRARDALEKKVLQSYTLDDIVTQDPTIRKHIETIPVIADSESSVLVLGETGVGKDVIARAIHNMSYRREGPFIKVNCAAIPSSMLESELFGYKKGAFTDAKNDKPGKFQLAHNGTIFLDEIGEMDLEMQAKMLHVLEESEFFALGATKVDKVNSRVIAATNCDLDEHVRQGRFRKDLYYRLKVCEFFIPPLRERIVDISLLTDSFISQSAAMKNKRVFGIHDETKKILMQYDFPGNVRELKNIIEYAVMMCQDEITNDDLPQYIYNTSKKKTKYYMLSHQEYLSLEHGEKSTLLQALNFNEWHIQNTAKSLGINRTTLWRKMKKYSLSFKKQR